MGIRLAATVIASLLIASLIGVGSAMAEPTITVSPNSGSQGVPFTVTGQGFQPGDKIYISIGPREAPSGYGIGVVFADSQGSFAASTKVGNVHDSEPFPQSAPPGEGYTVQLAPGDYEILAYPESFGGRTGETITASPKVRFTVTASSLPSTGGPPDSGHSPLVALTVGLALIVVGAFICQNAWSLRTRPERARQRSGD
jgi:hypothetical protein